MKRFLIILIVFFAINIGKSQDAEMPNYFIKYAPLSLIDPITPSFQFAFEQRFSPRISMHYDFGIITPRDFFAFREKGYRTRIEYRIYRKGFQPERRNFFYGPNFIAKQTFEEMMRNVCITPDCSSSAQFPTVRMKTSVGSGFGFGWNKVTKNNLLLELELVQGLLYYFRDDLGLPPIASQPFNNTQFFFLDDFSFFGGVNNTILPTFHFIFRIGLGVK
jgi:hypothetical protein